MDNVILLKTNINIAFSRNQNKTDSVAMTALGANEKEFIHMNQPTNNNVPIHNTKSSIKWLDEKKPSSIGSTVFPPKISSDLSENICEIESEHVTLLSVHSTKFVQVGAINDFLINKNASTINKLDNIISELIKHRHRLASEMSEIECRIIDVDSIAAKS